MDSLGQVVEKNWFDNTMHYLEFYYRDHTIYGVTFATKDGEDLTTSRSFNVAENSLIFQELDAC